MELASLRKGQGATASRVKACPTVMELLGVSTGLEARVKLADALASLLDTVEVRALRNAYGLDNIAPTILTRRRMDFGAQPEVDRSPDVLKAREDKAIEELADYLVLLGRQDGIDEIEVEAVALEDLDIARLDALIADLDRLQSTLSSQAQRVADELNDHERMFKPVSKEPDELGLGSILRHALVGINPDSDQLEKLSELILWNLRQAYRLGQYRAFEDSVLTSALYKGTRMLDRRIAMGETYMDTGGDGGDETAV